MAVNITQQADASAGLQGTDGDTGAFIFVNIPYNTTTPLTMSGCVLTRRAIVKSIVLNPDVAASNAVTVSAFKAPSATALGSGTVLHSGTGNLQGTAGTNILPTLSVVSGALDCAANTRVGIVISGALGAAGSGIVTIALCPA